MRQKAILPQFSAFVSASAGSGKTKTLIDRLVNLLLSNVRPSKILCLAFTKAAAAEILNRINQKLADFAICKREQLLKELAELGFSQVTPEIEFKARILFAEFLEEAEPINIQTIHAFTQSLLMKFPFEAGVNFNFTLLSENQLSSLIEQSKNTLLNSIENYPYAQQALNYLSWHIKEYTLKELLSEIISNRENLDIFFQAHKNLESILEEKIDETEIITNFISNIPLSLNQLEPLYDGGKLDIKRAEIIAKFLKHSLEIKIMLIGEYLDCFLTQTGDKLKVVLAKNLCNKYPQLQQELEQEQQRVYEFSQNLKAVKAKNLTRNFTILSYHIRNIYAQLKQQNNSLDYDDLISLSNKLLNNGEYAEWIRYKLDGGIDHILIDEAQDTSTSQWQIINKLSEEFFYQTEVPKSFFVVGDAKQSIFSFQGAKPELFNAMNNYLPEDVVRVTLNKSFRSGRKILKLVDDIFNKPHIKPLVTGIEPIIRHIAHKDIEAEVQLWPLVIEEEKSVDKPWALPSDFIHNESQSSDEKLAKLIAEYVQNKVNNPGDVMVLTRRRTGFVNHLIKELRSRNIPVNGLDRLKLMEHKAIQDIVALINFLLYPKDDFNLAIVLKSPIYGMLEAELLELCYHRPSTLWEALTDKSLLQELIDLSRTKTIFEFFFYIFEYKEIRAKLIQEFDLEVNDVLDSFLDLILQFEAENISSLQLFLNYLSTNKTEIKRDLFTNKECLKVMTVHGAKGLQAPIVILADTTSLPHNADSIVWLNEQELIWPGREKYYSSQAIEAKGKKLAKDYAEYLRLLYVALTRAEDKLIICGISKDETISDKCWYSIIREVVNSDDYTKSPNTS